MRKVVTFGEIMLRLSTSSGESLSQVNNLTVNYGGAEANVAISLSHFGYDAYFLSKVPENHLGLAVKRHLWANGVRTDYLLNGGERLGIYFLETGAGERSAQVTYDRKYSSFSALQANEVNLDEILTDAELFHVSGITLALSAELREIALMAMKKAKEFGVKTSFDFNYRSKLWSQKNAGEVFKSFLPYADICFLGELDAVYLLGLPQADPSLSQTERLEYYYENIALLYPNIQVMSSTFRTVRSASSNKLQGNLFINGQLYQSKIHNIEPIIDRVGGGDAFAAGILSGILERLEPQQIITFAAAASTLKHTIHGDCNVFSKEEVFRFTENDSGKIVR